MTLTGKAKIFKHKKGYTLYCAIPAKIVKDSAFTLRSGEVVDIQWQEILQRLIIRKKIPTREEIANFGISKS